MSQLCENQAESLREVEKYKERLSIALKASRICVFEVDLPRQLYTFFENAEDIFGVSGQKILQEVSAYSKLPAEEYQRAVTEYFSHPEDMPVISRAFDSVFQGNPISYVARMRACGSEFKWCKLDITPLMENGVPVKMIGVITDISAQKAKTDYLEQELQRDDFTGLYNKTHAIRAIRDILAENSHRRHAMLLLDVDDFKQFNDTYGHAVGDQILLLVAQELKRNFRSTDVVGRFGGDEFIVLMRDVDSFSQLSEKLGRLICCAHGEYCCTNSIGVAIYPDHADNFEKLFEAVDTALYKAKESKKTYTLFSSLNSGF